MELGLIGFAVAKGWWREKLRGYWWTLKHFCEILKKRRATQETRRVPDCIIIHRFVGVISYQEINNPFLRYFANPIFSLFWGITRRFIFW
jgi:hypothetical protein